MGAGGVTDGVEVEVGVLGGDDSLGVVGWRARSGIGDEMVVGGGDGLFGAPTIGGELLSDGDGVFGLGG